MDVIVLAGGTTGIDDLLYDAAKGGYKALIDIGGKPMLQWGLDALSGSSKIGHVVIVGLPEKTNLECKHPLTMIADHGGIVNNIKAGAKELLKIHPDPEAKVLALSADVPAITPEIVDWLINEVEKTDHDIYYSIIKKDVMEARFPGSKRSFIHLKDIDVCGGDFNAARLGIAAGGHAFIDELSKQRKNVIKQAYMVGFGTVFLLLMRQLTLENAIARVCKQLDLTGRAILNPYAEVGMDVDKPFQLDIMRKELTGQ
ncbi:MAG: nucleotidyltransferase family protein [Anaerolineaceae bacterium]|nr:nucleotidyltransferase family protein [Anaerolineaceae bacterium]